MRAAWLIFFMFAAVYAIEHDDLLTFFYGYINGLKLEEDINIYLKCVNDTIGETWEAFFNYSYNKKDWNKFSTFFIIFKNFMHPTLDSLGMLAPCTTNEIFERSKKLREWEKASNQLYNELYLMKSECSIDLLNFIAKWEGKDYEEAGKLAGYIINYVFFKE